MHRAYVDGACRPNPGLGAYRHIIYDEKGLELRRESGLVGRNTSNNGPSTPQSAGGF